MQNGTARLILAKTLSAIRRPKRDTVITTVLLLDLDDRTLRIECLESIRRGTARIDEELVLSLYSAGDDKAKLAIARSVAVSRMSPCGFRKVFDPVYARSDLSVQQRRKLMWNLTFFLGLNPRQGRTYERIILELARSPRLDLSVCGIPLAARLAPIDADMLALFRRHLRSRSPDIRLTTLNAFRHLLERLEQLEPGLRDFIVSDAFRKRVVRMLRSDPDEYVRKGAWWLLRKLRETLPPRARR